MKKYVCVFCDERKYIDTAYKTSEHIGICTDCYNALDKTAPAQPYAGISDIAYIMSPFEYTDRMRDVILQFKFKSFYAYARLFASLMEDYLSSYDIWDSFDYIIPVPLHESRIKERGYNQSELIASHVSEFIGVPMRNDILKRVRATKRQSSLQKPDRILNVRNAFECHTDISGKRILLFDDICTTRSTLTACAKALKESNPEMICALTLSIQKAEHLLPITY